MSIGLAVLITGLQQLAAALTAPIRGVPSPMFGPFDLHLLLGVALLVGVTARVILRAVGDRESAANRAPLDRAIRARCRT